MISGPIPSPGMSVAGIACGIDEFSRFGEERLGYSNPSGLRRAPVEDEEIIRMTRRWLERAVIGLNLCPFAASPYRSGRVRFTISHERTAAGLLQDLSVALTDLQGSDPRQVETTLLIHPWVLNDFAEYNEFLEVCDEAVVELDLEGELQVASFHPQYQFAGTAPADVENCTNRSPFPMLHLLREESVAVAVEAADTEEISQRNIRVLREMGNEGWMDLWRDT
jgi:hypothetical protein